MTTQHSENLRIAQENYNRAKLAYRRAEIDYRAFASLDGSGVDVEMRAAARELSAARFALRAAKISPAT